MIILWWLLLGGGASRWGNITEGWLLDQNPLSYPRERNPKEAMCTQHPNFCSTTFSRPQSSHVPQKNLQMIMTPKMTSNKTKEFDPSPQGWTWQRHRKQVSEPVVASNRGKLMWNDFPKKQSPNSGFLQRVLGMWEFDDDEKASLPTPNRHQD